ncbi:MAG TPA: hypothetical protein VKA74_09850 [Myxococcota bacterium]|nr:hypothetical protein [Myxococcota bacterium]
MDHDQRASVLSGELSELAENYYDRHINIVIGLVECDCGKDDCCGERMIASVGMTPGGDRISKESFTAGASMLAQLGIVYNNLVREHATRHGVDPLKLNEFLEEEANRLARIGAVRVEAPDVRGGGS